MAIDTVHHRLLSACANQKMVVMESDSGKALATVAIGEGVDGAEFDPAGFALASGGDGALTVIGTADGAFAVSESLTTAPRARSMAIDPKAHRVYLPTAEFEAPMAGGTGRPAMKPGTFRIVVVGT
ncbi:MAG: hypothetical protein IPJ41_04290 [Phycisphaerales bacterium]|nr:hypothetical protein [Phycisphaerales bacterium]